VVGHSDKAGLRGEPSARSFGKALSSNIVGSELRRLNGAAGVGATEGKPSVPADEVGTPKAAACSLGDHLYYSLEASTSALRRRFAGSSFRPTSGSTNQTKLEIPPKSHAALSFL